MKRGRAAAFGLLALALAALPARARASPGFLVGVGDARPVHDATIVVLMRDGARTVVSMLPAFRGPAEPIALVIPVPASLRAGDVKTTRPVLIDRVGALSGPRAVEYEEFDPCAAIPERAEGSTGATGAASTGGAGGRPEEREDPGREDRPGEPVRIAARFEVGEYDVELLSAAASSDLEGWLRGRGYEVPPGAAPRLQPYVERGMRFLVARVDPARLVIAPDGRARLSPLRFHYDSDAFTLPVRLGAIGAPDGASGAVQDLWVHILAPGVRYEVDSGSNVVIPTNLELDGVGFGAFARFYESLFERTLAEHPRAVVTEYAWSAGECAPPCREAPLDHEELLQLGADVLPGWSEAATLVRASPLVQLRAASVAGDLDSAIIRRIGRAHLGEVEDCFAPAFARDPDLAGRVEIAFTVGPNGEVSASRVHDSTIKDPQPGVCLARTVRGWKFPRPDDGGAATIRLPIVLSRKIEGTTIAGSFVHTRLRARVDANSEDLVFRAAEPIVGGHEPVEAGGPVERGATIRPGGVNAFVARYTHRREWTGAITCRQPVRGRWRVASWCGTEDSPAPELAPGGVVTAAVEPAVVAAVEPGVVEPAAVVAPRGGCTCASEPELPGSVMPLLAVLALFSRRRR